MGKRSVKGLVFAFALCMMLLFIPEKADAAVVAKIGNTSYSSLEAALRYVKNKQTIVLQKNVTIKKQLKIKNSRKFTIDLNKHTIKLARGKKGSFMYDSGCIKLRNKTRLTIKNGKVKASHKDYRDIFDIDEKASLTIAGGTYDGVITNYGKLTIKKGTFTEGHSDVALIWNIGTLTIQGGKFKETVADADVICNLKSCTISGGKFQAPAGGRCVYSYRNSNYKHAVTLHVKGGEYSFIKSGMEEETIIQADKHVTADISGGKFHGKVVVNGKTVK